MRELTWKGLTKVGAQLGPKIGEWCPERCLKSFEVSSHSALTASAERIACRIKALLFGEPESRVECTLLHYYGFLCRTEYTKVATTSVAPIASRMAVAKWKVGLSV